MKLLDHQFHFSATDLANHFACNHLTELNRLVAEQLLQREYRRDPMVELLVELGQKHEAAYLAHLRESGRTVVEIEVHSSHAASQTIQAMKGGADVIAQALLLSHRWEGRADLLLKVDRPSLLGNWSYEVADTKLSQTTKGQAVLQLCLYSDILSQLQGSMPIQLHVVKPGNPFDIDTMPVHSFMAYYRMVRKSLENRIASGPNASSYPAKNAQCDFCHWWSRCEKQWRDDDHLSFVAGMSKAHTAELHRQGIHTLQSFAESNGTLPQPPKYGSKKGYLHLHQQAFVQLQTRKRGEPYFEFLAKETDRGLLRLPTPSPGDLFLDFEGNPHASDGGLEYLLGFVNTFDRSQTYHAHWALTRAEEKIAFESFIDFATKQAAEFPDFHIYHFAPYEPAAIKRLMIRHQSRRQEVEQLLRDRRFVDLFGIVKQSIRAGVESYSIKKLEPYYQFVRAQDLSIVGGTLRGVECLLEKGLIHELTDEQRNIVELYNQDDCLSTLALREWLERLRAEKIAEGWELPRPDLSPNENLSTRQQESAEILARIERLLEGIDGEPQDEQEAARVLLANLLGYFCREDRVAAFDRFRMGLLEPDALLYESNVIAGLTLLDQRTLLETTTTKNGKVKEREWIVSRYQYEDQEFHIEDGADLYDIRSASDKGKKIGTLHSVDTDSRIIEIKESSQQEREPPEAVFTKDFNNKDGMRRSLKRFADRILSHSSESVQEELLHRRKPRLVGCSLPAVGSPTESAVALVSKLDRSVLPIQGPPGTGKTTLGGKMIAALIAEGKRVGVTAVSHKVIENLLLAVQNETAGSAPLAHRKSRLTEGAEGIYFYSEPKETSELLDSGYVVGATAFLWSTEEYESTLDYLFIDEAGQMSLAMALAASQAAENVVLLGDPMQLEQPQKAHHPNGSDVSVLGHMLGDHPSMPPDRGIFLDETWRLHPDICRFTTEQYYEGRLKSRQGLDRQRIEGQSSLWDGLTQHNTNRSPSNHGISPIGSGELPSLHGLYYFPVEHEHNQSHSREEAAAIGEVLATLLDGNHYWVDAKGKKRVLGVADILVVAPYNAQVSLLKRTLPEGVRVGTVDRFQGQEAPLVVYSMTTSTAEDAPRGMEFLYSPNRLNVATSRARSVVFLFGSPKLFEPNCMTPHQMQLANSFCRYRELATLCHLG